MGSSGPARYRRDVPIDALSCASLLIDCYSNAPPSLAVGSGFVVVDGDDLVLVTNYHVLSGRHADTDAPIRDDAAIPDRVLLAVPRVPSVGHLSGWTPFVAMLDGADGARTWVAHPKLGRALDVAVLPLGRAPSLDPLRRLAYHLDPGPDVALTMGSDVCIVGFPDGLTAAGMKTIWKSAHLASDPTLDVDGRPYFWIDAAGAPGMSGSPVVARRSGGVAMANGSFLGGPGIFDRLLGVYSGRASRDTTLGRVWKWERAREAVEHALSELRAGRLVPEHGAIGVFPKPDDVRVETETALGCGILHFVRSMAAEPCHRLADVRDAAVVQAAIRAVPDAAALILPRATREFFERCMAEVQLTPVGEGYSRALRGVFG